MSVCGKPGEYLSRITLWMPPYWTTAKSRRFDVDACIASLMLMLIHKHGIRTIECCCGHGTGDGYISVDRDSQETMLALGFGISELGPRPDLFSISAKSITHIGPKEEYQHENN